MVWSKVSPGGLEDAVRQSSIAFGAGDCSCVSSSLSSVVDGRCTFGVSVARLTLAVLGRSPVRSLDKTVENLERDSGEVGSERRASASACVASSVVSCTGRAGVSRLEPRVEADGRRTRGALGERERPIGRAS